MIKSITPNQIKKGILDAISNRVYLGISTKKSRFYFDRIPYDFRWSICRSCCSRKDN